MYLAQRLLVAAAPHPIVDNMTGLAVKLFGNQVLTEGIKAMEERAAAEAAFRAAVEQAAREERERMEAEARVLDVVRFDSNKSVARPGALSRAVSMAVARSHRREMSRAQSRAISRAVSRAVSRRVSNAMDSSQGGSGASTPPGALRPGSMAAAAAAALASVSADPKQSSDGVLKKKKKEPRTGAGGGVRFGGDDEGGDGPKAPQGNADTDAALAAAAAALMQAAGSGAGAEDRSDAGSLAGPVGGAGLLDIDPDHRSVASFITGSMQVRRSTGLACAPKSVIWALQERLQGVPGWWLQVKVGSLSALPPDLHNSPQLKVGHHHHGHHGHGHGHGHGKHNHHHGSRPATATGAGSQVR